MAIGFATTPYLRRGILQAEICPNLLNGACACARDVNGNPQPAHRVVTAPAAHPPGTTAPDPNPVQSALREALQALASELRAGAPVPLSQFGGMTV
jgi:hypothetical protein